jgi:hypothetical protein
MGMNEILMLYVLAGMTVAGIALYMLTTLVNLVLDAITWLREDPDHLPIPDDWEPDKSRGRLYKGWLR